MNLHTITLSHRHVGEITLTYDADKMTEEEAKKRLREICREKECEIATKFNEAFHSEGITVTEGIHSYET